MVLDGNSITFSQNIFKWFQKVVKKKIKKKTYGRNWISWCVRIVALISTNCKKKQNSLTKNMSCFMCHVSHVSYHLSPINCHLSPTATATNPPPFKIPTMHSRPIRQDRNTYCIFSFNSTMLTIPACHARMTRWQAENCFVLQASSPAEGLGWIIQGKYSR